MNDKVIDWLEGFAQCVREVNYATARDMCLPDIISFGTVAEAVKGIDNLVETQWKMIWPNTKGFRFITDGLHTWGDHVIGVGAEWHSIGLGSGGNQFTRRGRSTIILVDDNGVMRASHTHFSAMPTPQFPDHF